ncbi:MAG: I78 family peptidase inhibitor [Candidatus Andeanibacterium colombiense]|uniref:I78 family peptidase inhibitor n=1 Tax=Candidatus Andeanibacterium colombiense TaxID=3121345 RepID=A0AAJ5X7T9_9SPHN|nr:MAG: I78 family peptidase inhibitor [Sphingomonadaceae bacterium]
MKRSLFILGALALAGCASTGNSEVGTGDRTEDVCKPEPGQVFVGQKATAELGAKLLQATGAKRLRWVPPRTVVTMDYRPDRLTVTYDDDLVIERVSCG